MEPHCPALQEKVLKVVDLDGDSIQRNLDTLLGKRETMLSGTADWPHGKTHSNKSG